MTLIEETARRLAKIRERRKPRAHGGLRPITEVTGGFLSFQL
jgi:hypothetical protein